MDAEAATGHNFGLREEIKSYWSARAATFDQSPGHEIFSEEERRAWHGLIIRHLGRGEGRRALDLACGTGVVSHLMDDLGYDVTGLDWAEPMLERARAKAKTRGRTIAFRIADAENTMEPDGSYDVVVTRHLVWTLVDPKQAFAEWLRVLKPGGTLLIVDGDFVNTGIAERFLKVAARWLERMRLAKAGPMQPTEGMAEIHNRILSRVHFSDGARAEQVAELIEDAGFANVAVDTDMRAIHRAQSKHLGYLKGLSRGLQHRYAIVARKPFLHKQAR